MKCYICNKNYRNTRNFLTLLEIERTFICENCYKKYPIELDTLEFTNDDYNIRIIALFKEKHYFDTTPFWLEKSQVYREYMNTYEYIFLYDTISLTDNFLEWLSTLSKLVKQDILVVCYHMRN